MKLVLHALHENNVPFINDGEPVKVVEITTLQSLLVILAVLVLTVVLSLFSLKGKAKTVVGRLRRHLAAFLEEEPGTPAAERAARYAALVEAEQAVRDLPPEVRALIHERQTLRELLAEAHARQGARSGAA